MAKRPTQKEIAQQYYDRYQEQNRRTTYYRRKHRLRRLRSLLSLGLFGVAVLWIVSAYALDDRSIYSNGPLSFSHAQWENDCAQCHTEEFGSVQKESCLACHFVRDHVPADQGEDPACGMCHAEHRGAQSLIDSVSSAHCNECHESHADLTSFADHGPFRPRKDHDQHLRFDHQRHLDPELPGKLRLAGFNEPLGCADCHVPDATNESFTAINFVAHCQRCHKEMLDPVASDEAVPHGIQPKQLNEWIEGFYTRRRDAKADFQSIRDATDAALAALFDAKSKKSCLLCHTAPKDGVIPPPEVPLNWRRASSFDKATPLARFDHKAHRFPVAGKTADENCLACHTGIPASTSAEELNLPGIESCKDCHKPGGAGTTCATCHPYHPHDPRSWR